jgi:SAM-dependent methyltransferase
VLDEFGTVVGVDRSDEALRLSATRGPFALVQASAECLPFPDDTFDVVTALDLLEHLDDDAAAMGEIRRVLRPGGIAVLTLPAHRFLWSEHDVALDHRRRYVAADCRRLLREVGLRQVRLTYAIALLFPPIFAFRVLQRIFNPVERSRAQTALHVLPGPMNALLIRLLDWETAFLLRANLPIGVSLVAVAEKPQAGV